MEINVLLVDDEKELADHMAERLISRGLAVTAVYDGESAIRFVKENTVDVMVLDLIMPGMDGLQTLREVKKIRPDIHVLMLTGHGTIDTAMEGKKEGASEYLIKPCDIIQLTSLIKDTCKAASNG